MTLLYSYSLELMVLCACTQIHLDNNSIECLLHSITYYLLSRLLNNYYLIMHITVQLKYTSHP